MADETGAEYELLVRDIVRRLASKAAVDTTSVDRDVDVAGRATTNQIDVVWDFNDAAGQARRVVFEARDHKNPIKQGALHAFRSVVDDIQDADRPVTGVMVTTAGYQAGAQRVAQTYGLLVLELRPPTPADLKNRVSRIEVEFTFVIPVVRDISFDFTEILDQEALTERSPWDPLFLMESGAEQSSPLQAVLADGEIGTLEVPRALHHVRRSFEPPATLIAGQTPAALLRVVEATVGSSAGPPVTVVVEGLESVAWMLRDALTDARAWFSDGGDVWATGPEILPCP